MIYSTVKIFMDIVGHAINKLTKHSDGEVRATASRVVAEWSEHYEQKLDRPMIEVKSDMKTEKLRKTGRKLLAAQLKLSVSLLLWLSLTFA